MTSIKAKTDGGSVQYWPVIQSSFCMQHSFRKVLSLYKSICQNKNHANFYLTSWLTYLSLIFGEFMIWNPEAKFNPDFYISEFMHCKCQIFFCFLIATPWRLSLNQLQSIQCLSCNNSKFYPQNMHTFLSN